MKYAPELMYGDTIESFARASQWMDWDNNELQRGQHTLVTQLVRLPSGQRDSLPAE